MPARRRLARQIALAGLALLLVGCGAIRPPVRTAPATTGALPAVAAPPRGEGSRPDQPPPADASTPPDAAPETAGPADTPDDGTRPAVETGLASWYGKPFHGRRTASGERFDMNALTAAHKTLPMQSYVRVRNPANQREVIVRINDRGPFKRGRIIDLSRAAARTLGIDGVALVEVHRLADDPERSGAAAPAGGRVADATP